MRGMTARAASNQTTNQEGKSPMIHYGKNYLVEVVSALDDAAAWTVESYTTTYPDRTPYDSFDERTQAWTAFATRTTDGLRVHIKPRSEDWLYNGEPEPGTLEIRALAPPNPDGTRAIWLDHATGELWPDGSRECIQFGSNAEPRTVAKRLTRLVIPRATVLQAGAREPQDAL